MKLKTTRELQDALSVTKDLDCFLAENQEQFIRSTPSACLQHHLNQRCLKRNTVIRASCLDEVYAYQIFNGTRTPSRDKLLCLLLALALSVEEAQSTLKACGYPPLYAKDPRDCVLLHAFNQGWDVEQLNTNLHTRDMAILG